MFLWHLLPEHGWYKAQQNPERSLDVPFDKCQASYGPTIRENKILHLYVANIPGISNIDQTLGLAIV